MKIHVTDIIQMKDLVIELSKYGVRFSVQECQVGYDVFMSNDSYKYYNNEKGKC